MPSLSELSQLEGPRSQDMLGWLLQYSPVIRTMEARSAFELGATDFDLYPVDGSGSVQTRGVGGNYSQNAETPPTRQTEELGFHGDAVTIDRSHVVDDQRGLRPIQTWVNNRLRMKARFWSRGISNLVFQGAGGTGPREMLGLQNLLDGTNVPGFSIPMVIDAVDFLSTSPNSLDLSDNSHVEAFRRGMEQIVPQFDDPVIFANDQLGAVMGTIARQSQSYERIEGAFESMIERIFGGDLVRVSPNAIGTSEPDNAGTPNNVTTSLYIADPMPGAWSLVTNGGLEVEDELDEILEDLRSGKIEWELRMENAIQDRYAIRRIRNIKIPAGVGDYIV